MEKTIYTNEYRALLEWLRKERKRKGLTLRRLAERLNVHHSILGRIEQGERRLDIVEFARICKAIGCVPQEGFDLVIPLKHVFAAVSYPSLHTSRRAKAAEPPMSYSGKRVSRRSN